MGQSGAYITLSIIIIMFSLFFGVILSCTVPLPSAVRPPAITFKVVFWIGVGWCMKSAIYGVTQHDALESIIACDVSFVHVLVDISTAIFRSSLFCMVDIFCRGKSSCSSDVVSC
jgi:hypothetical protein